MNSCLPMYKIVVSVYCYRNISIFILLSDFLFYLQNNIHALVITSYMELALK